jgi:TonB family protein
MSAETIELTADFTHDPARGGPSPLERQPIFWLWLACAALVHAAFIVGIGGSSLRRMGEAGGMPDAINVELVDEADLRSEAPPASATPPGAAVQPPRPAPQPPQPPQQPLEPDPAHASEAAPSFHAPIPPLAATPDWPSPTESKAAQTKDAPAKQARPKPQAHLDLSLPSDLPAATAPQGAASSVSRPPGVTRSGENDEFGRGVIRALRKTMPMLDVRGRVTVRIVLSPRGDKADVRLVQSGGDKNFDFEVMFSVNQASFPFPPKGATVTDRTFLVTYIYK